MGDTMKPLLVIFFLLIHSVSLFAQTNEGHLPISQLISIDDDYTPPLHVDEFEEIDEVMEELNVAPISVSRANSLFSSLTKDSRARMRRPGGLCSRRRIHIKNVLRGKGVTSGRLYIYCPANNGRLRLRDRVSGRYFTYSNFHDTNIVLVNTGSGNFYRVMDLQFQSGPVSLPTYLGQIRAYQRILPSSKDAGTCYYRVSYP